MIGKQVFLHTHLSRTAANAMAAAGPFYWAFNVLARISSKAFCARARSRCGVADSHV
tara:strand:- start:199 stop:369 length:171 start_codon:yes stop_codon:yes gene_type:complete